MSAECVTYCGGPIFDGERLLKGHHLRLEHGRITALSCGPDAPIEGQIVELSGDILCPGFVDLQVNGGDGLMFNDAPTAQTLARIAAAHHRLGATTILPTLITDTPETTARAIDATCTAIAEGIPGIAGLHLEGPHLDPARKGAHDGALIRPMGAEDLEGLVDAAARLPVLMVTLAPQSTSLEQVAALAKAGVIVSLGHSNTDFDTAQTYAKAGASCATHLFNAMSQMSSRAPGLVGAALATSTLNAGVIADGIHVHPAMLRAAWSAKEPPGALFLVSDAMACAGTDVAEFTLGGRRVLRQNGRLTLEDGTLAGADLDLPRALQVLTQEAGIDLAAALRAATSIPAQLARLGPGIGRLRIGEAPALLRLSPDLHLRANLNR